MIRRGNPWLSALVPGVAALGVAAPLLSGAPGPAELATGVAAGLAAAVLAGGLFARPAFRAIERWRKSVGTIAERLLGAAPAAGAEPDPAQRLESVGPLPGEDALEEALSALVAALQDEELLARRRREQQASVAAALHRGHELVVAAGDDAGAVRRLATLLDDTEAGARAARDATEVVRRSSVEAALGARASCTRARRDADDLETRLDASSALVRRLEARSREIGQVLIVLNDITEQTNLLALNAAIIAAQAGEHGKGFGVVADEMRNLSERASSSTKETEILAKALDDEVAKAVRSMAEAGDVSKGLRGAIGETGDLGARLADLGKQSADGARSAAVTTERHAAGVGGLVDRFRQLREEWAKLERWERELVLPSTRALRDSTELLHGLWEKGAVHDGLRQRLERAVAAIREERRQGGRHRAELERWAEELRALRRERASRDDVVREIAREIRRLESASF
jgi:methyl-accepting chemotaxis protein